MKDIPIGSVWSSEPFDPIRDFSQKVVKFEGSQVVYESGSGDRVSVNVARFLSMFPYRCRDLESDQDILAPEPATSEVPG